MLPKLTLLSNALDRLNKLVVNDSTPIESARRAADSLIKYCLNPDSDKAEKLALVADDVLAGKPKLLRDAPLEDRRADCLPVPPEDDGVSDPNDLVEKSFLDYGVPLDFDEHDVAFYKARFIRQILARRAEHPAASGPLSPRERVGVRGHVSPSTGGTGDGSSVARVTDRTATNGDHRNGSGCPGPRGPPLAGLRAPNRMSRRRRAREDKPGTADEAGGLNKAADGARHRPALPQPADARLHSVRGSYGPVNEDRGSGVARGLRSCPAGRRLRATARLRLASAQPHNPVPA